MAGEYGEKCGTCENNRYNCNKHGCGKFKKDFGRPHYHAIIFNHKFKDLELDEIRKGEKYYTSKECQSMWRDEKTKRSRGKCIIGKVTFESAAYVARYTTKKITGKRARDHYRPIITNDGREIERVPEFSQMSKKPSIGKGWFDKYYKDIYRHDVMSVRCKNMRPPKYYDKEYEKMEPKKMAFIKVRRLDEMEQNKETDFNRILTKFKIQERKFGQLLRSYEDA